MGLRPSALVAFEGGLSTRLDFFNSSSTVSSASESESRAATTGRLAATSTAEHFKPLVLVLASRRLGLEARSAGPGLQIMGTSLERPLERPDDSESRRDPSTVPHSAPGPAAHACMHSVTMMHASLAERTNRHDASLSAFHMNNFGHLGLERVQAIYSDDATKLGAVRRGRNGRRPK